MKISTQKVYYRVILGSMPMGKGRKQDWEREKLRSDVVLTKASGDPSGSSETELALQSCSECG